MTGRRGFFGKVLGGIVAAVAGPKVLKVEPEVWGRTSLEDYPGYGLRGLTDDGTFYTTIYNDRMWLTGKTSERAYVYYRVVPIDGGKPERVR